MGPPLARSVHISCHLFQSLAGDFGRGSKVFSSQASGATNDLRPVSGGQRRGALRATGRARGAEGRTEAVGRARLGGPERGNSAEKGIPHSGSRSSCPLGTSPRVSRRGWKKDEKGERAFSREAEGVRKCMKMPNHVFILQDASKSHEQIRPADSHTIFPHTEVSGSCGQGLVSRLATRA